MVALVSLLIIVALSLLVVRIGTVALTMTGLSEEVAAFQSLSAFTGTGFTTKETESVVGTPARRRIVRNLIIFGNAGIITAMSSLVLSFTGAGEDVPDRVLMMVVGLIIMVRIAHSAWFGRFITPVIRRALARSSVVQLHDYAQLLGLQDGYSVVEILLHEDDWVRGFSLRTLRLTDEGVLVLGMVKADGRFIGGPSPEAIGEAGDTLIVYGPARQIQELANRRAGDEDARDRAVTMYQKLRHAEERV